MNCDCIEKLVGEIKARPEILNKPWKDAELIDLHCSGMMLETKSGKWQLMIPYTTRYSRNTKAGGKQFREQALNIKADFCPFCGKPTAP